MIIHEFFCIPLTMIDEHAHERAANKMKNNRNGEHDNEPHPDRNRQADMRKFEESDMEAIYSLLSDEEVNTFLPQ